MNKENVKQLNSECSNVLNVEQSSVNNVDKMNGNMEAFTVSRNGESDSASNILNMKNNNAVQNNVNGSKTNYDNGDSQTSQGNKVQNVPGTNLQRNQMTKSTPHINLASSYVDVHPLSNSLMEPSRNVQRYSRPTNILQNSQVHFSQSSNRLDSDALCRITAQFTPSQIPIVGYEVMEERARFTIYKLRIDDPRTGLSWMVFRRYTDFVRLYQKLKIEHHNLILPLPEKRLFRNNFDPSFLEDRMRGLQLFVNTVVKKMSLDRNVREFFCLDEPPDVADSEPEAQALFGAMEDTVGGLKNQLRQQEDTIKYLRQKVFYLEEKMKSCSVCNPLGNASRSLGVAGHSPMSSASSNGS